MQTERRPTKSDFSETRLSYDVEFQAPPDVNQPLLLSERRLVRIQLARYLRIHGSDDDAPMSEEQFSGLLASYVDKRPPSKTAVEGFIRNSAKTSVRIVRIFKQFLIDIGFSRREDFNCGNNADLFVLCLKQLTGASDLYIYGDRFSLAIDDYFMEYLNWDIVRQSSGLMRIDENVKANGKPTVATDRKGYAFSTEKGQIIGIIQSIDTSSVIQFELHPDLSKSSHRNYVLNGTSTIIKDAEGLTFNRANISANLLNKVD